MGNELLILIIAAIAFQDFFIGVIAIWGLYKLINSNSLAVLVGMLAILGFVLFMARLSV